jgi:hypothetical protein
MIVGGPELGEVRPFRTADLDCSRFGSFRIVFGVLFFVRFATWIASLPWRKGWCLVAVT